MALTVNGVAVPEEKVSEEMARLRDDYARFVRENGGEPSETAMRVATARAASRRGSSTRSLRPWVHGSSSSASGTTVLLPAPGGACSTAARRERRACLSSGSAARTGRSGAIGKAYANGR